MPSTDARFGALHVEDRVAAGGARPRGRSGAPDGTSPDPVPLVLLHGFTGDTTTWAPFVRAFGFERRVLAVDLPGHGRSAERMPVSIEETANAVADAVEAAVGGPAVSPAVHWLGYSMGGRVALRLACDRPDRVASLTLVGATPGIKDLKARLARREADEALAASILHEGVAAFVDHWMAQPLFQSQRPPPAAVRAAAREQRLRNTPEGLAAALRTMGTGTMEPLWDRLSGLTMPVLLVTGGEDEKFAKLAAAMAVVFPNARHIAVPGAGHAVQTDDPTALGAAVKAFLRRAEE